MAPLVHLTPTLLSSFLMCVYQVLQLTRRIRLRHVSDVSMLDAFFMGCSVSRPCFPHVYNHFHAIKSVAQKWHHEVASVSVNFLYLTEILTIMLTV